MRSIGLIGLIGLIGFIALFSAPIAQAQFKLGPDCDPALSPSQPGACNIQAFAVWLKKIIGFLFTIAIPVGVIFIVWGGFVIMTAAGSEERVRKGRQIITAALIGVAIALGAWLLITALNFFIQESFQFK